MITENFKRYDAQTDSVRKTSTSEALEKSLASFGALSAIAIVRRNFPTTLAAIR